MERNDVVSKLGFKAANGSRDAVVSAFRKAGEKGLSVDEIGAIAGNTSKTGDISRTVASLVSHLRTKMGCDILKDESRYYLIGSNTPDGHWVPEGWVESRFSKE